MPVTAAQQSGLTAAYDRLRNYLDSRLNEDAIDLVRLYQSQRDLFMTRLQSIYDTYLWDEPALRSAMVSGASAELQDAIQSTVQELGSHLATASVGKMSELLATQPEIVAKNLGGIFDAVAWGDLAPSTQGLYDELSTAVLGGGTFFDRLAHGQELLRQQLANTVQASLLNGETFDELRGRMIRAWGVDKLADPKGSAFGSVKTYQNAARGAWNDLMGDFADDAGDEAVEVWWAIVEGDLSKTTTPGCAARHGRTIDSIGERPPGLHWNCRCTVAVLPSDTDLSVIQADGALWLKAHGYSRKQATAMEAWTRR